MGLLYDGVAIGMWAYGQAAFRVTALGPRRFRFTPGTLVLVTHRAETDVPLVCPPLYLRAGLWHRRSPLERMAFAARDDMFLTGFLAGFAPGLSPAARARLFPFGVGRWLPVVQVHPLRSASVARLGEALRLRRDEPLDAVLRGGEADAFRARAARCGLDEPVRVADAFRGEYADLLWRPVEPGHPATDGLDGFWAGRAAQAASDFRRLVELLRAGGTLVVFPEGRPSADGAIGPIQRGLAGLVRRGAPKEVRPVALAYDPLGRGRPRVTIAIGDAAPAPREAVEATTLALLRRTMPLTAGQIVAAGVDPDDAIAEAHSAGRPVDPELLDARRRAPRLAEAAEAVSRKPGAVAFVAREFASAREAGG